MHWNIWPHKHQVYKFRLTLSKLNISHIHHWINSPSPIWICLTISLFWHRSRKYAGTMITSWHGGVSAILVLCEANPSVTGAFPVQGWGMRRFDILFVISLNQLWDECSSYRWFETLWRFCDDAVIWAPSCTEASLSTALTTQLDIKFPKFLWRLKLTDIFSIGHIFLFTRRQITEFGMLSIYFSMLLYLGDT